MNVTAIESKACGEKVRMGAKRARAVAAELTRRSGRQVSPYRCVFCGSWHVGHTPSMAAVVDLAAVIRERAYPMEGSA